MNLLLPAALMALAGCAGPTSGSDETSAEEDSDGVAPAPAVHDFGIDECHHGVLDCNDWGPWDSTGLRTYGRPSSVYYGDRMHMVYRGDLDDNLYWSRYDGDRWLRGEPIRGARSRLSPALAIHRGRLNMIYTGLDGRLARMRYDGRHWSDADILPYTAGHRFAPALLSYNDRMHLIYGDERRRLYSGIFDGFDWGPSSILDDLYSDVTPAFARFGDRLFLSHSGIGNRLFISEFDRDRWHPRFYVRDAHLGLAPTFGVHDNLLHMVYGTRRGRIAWRAFDGRDWFGDVYLRGECGRFGLTFAPYGSRASLLCPGVRDDLLWSRFRARDW